MRVATGPATTQVKSATRTPSSGIVAISDHPFGGEHCQLGGFEAEIVAKNFRRMLTYNRRPPVDSPWRAAELVGCAGIPKCAAKLGMLNFGKVAAIEQLLIVEKFLGP